MAFTVREAELHAQELKGAGISAREDTFIGVAPSFSALSNVQFILQNTPVDVGAQNCSYKDKGAFTGEESVHTLNELGISFSLVGHSERRTKLNESNEIIRKKVVQLLSHNITVVLCIGEELSVREQGKQFSFVETQLGECVSGITNIHNLFIAYEPVWAISTSGSGRKATPKDAQEMHEHIRAFLKIEYSHEVGLQIPILYGGSVDDESIKEYLKQDDIDGALVGGASLDVKRLLKMFQV
jgi:triosephosphate isomerase